MDIASVTHQNQETEQVAEVSQEAKKQISKGTGPLFHRHYFAPIESTLLKRKEVIKEITHDLSAFCPTLMARFEKSVGSEIFQIGDEYCVHITGPFPAKVRVDDISPNGFSFTTLDDHLEAGQIAFYFDDQGFHIDSWARSRNELIDFLYDKAPVVRYMQSLMWEYFCKEVVKRIAPHSEVDVSITTDRFENRNQSTLKSVANRWMDFLKSFFSTKS